MRKITKWFILLLSIALVIFVVGCSGKSDSGASNEGASKESEKNEPQKTIQLSLATGNSGGTYYYVGAGMADILSSKIQNMQVATESTSGSPSENLTFVNQNINTLGIGTLDGGFDAINGEKDKGYPEPYENIRLLMGGHQLTVYFVTLSNSGIDSFEKLSGKKIGLPPAGSTANNQAITLLKKYGIEDYKGIPLSYSEQADGLKDGNLDLVIIGGSIPVASIIDLSTTKDIKILSPDISVLEQTIRENPFWSIGIIPANTYKGQDEPINALFAQVALYANAELPEDVAYEIVRTLNDSVDTLKEVHREGGKWCKESTLPLLKLDWIDFHPGAGKYWSEK